MVNINPVSEEAVMAALSKVQEPELHKDLVTLNMIRDVQIEDGKVGFTVMLTTPACPLRDQIEREVREAVTAIPGVENVVVAGRWPSARHLGTADSQCNSNCIRQRRRWEKHSGGKFGGRVGQIRSQGWFAGC